MPGRQRTEESVSTPGHGQGVGPVGSKLSRSDDADDDGRGRSEASRRLAERSLSEVRLPDGSKPDDKKRGWLISLSTF